MFIANDWHAGLVPLYLAARYRRNGIYKDARSIIAIHNLSHQGQEPAATFDKLGLPADRFLKKHPNYPEFKLFSTEHSAFEDCIFGQEQLQLIGAFERFLLFDI